MKTKFEEIRNEFKKEKKNMTKQELITELHNNGYLWANNSYSKAELQKHYDHMIEAQNMTIEELRETINNKNEKENDTMTTINLIDNTVTFELNGTTYTQRTETGRYSKTENGKTTRIGKAEFEAAYAEHEAEVAAKMHENLDKLVAQTEESNADEAAERVLDELAEDEGVTAEEFIEKLQKVEKEKKVRKAKKAKAAKKNAAFSYCPNGVDVITLTEKQVDFILHLPDTCFWEKGLDSCIWTDVLCDEIGGQFAGKPMTVGAMISTLCEKGLGVRAKNRINNRKCTSFALTDMGKQIAAELGLN